MKKFFKEFKAFISRGNILDLAVGVIIGGAFSAIVTAFTNKIIMPFINLLLSLGGANGLSSAYTFLKPVYLADGSIDLANSIYIDWGAFITAVIDFLIIAFTIFIILKVAMKSSEWFKKTTDKVVQSQPTKEERKELKKRGYSLKRLDEYKNALEVLREERKAEEEARIKKEEAEKPVVETDLDVLKQIRDLLKTNKDK